MHMASRRYEISVECWKIFHNCRATSLKTWLNPRLILTIFGGSVQALSSFLRVIFEEVISFRKWKISVRQKNIFKLRISGIYWNNPLHSALTQASSLRVHRLTLRQEAVWQLEALGSFMSSMLYLKGNNHYPLEDRFKCIQDYEVKKHPKLYQKKGNNLSWDFGIFRLVQESCK